MADRILLLSKQITCKTYLQLSKNSSRIYIRKFARFERACMITCTRYHNISALAACVHITMQSLFVFWIA